MFGTHIRLKADPQIREMIENECIRMFEEERDSVRQEAKEKISEIQRENARSFNKKRKKACYIRKETSLRLNELS